MEKLTDQVEKLANPSGRNPRDKSEGEKQMTRKFLEELGITEKETIDKILDENSANIGAVKAETEESAGELEKLKAEEEELKNKIEDLNSSLSEQESLKERLQTLMQDNKHYKVAELKQKVAKKEGIPLSIANRLQGEDEEALRKDAETLAKALEESQPTLPLGSTEPNDVDNENAKYENLIQAIRPD